MRPLNPETFNNPHMAQVARWHNLISMADQLTAHTGFGLADVWGHIKSANYGQAQALLYKHAENLRNANPPQRSKVPATRRYAEAMEVLEQQESEHAVSIREYVRKLRTEASSYRHKVRALEQQLEEATNGR